MKIVMRYNASCLIFFSVGYESQPNQRYTFHFALLPTLSIELGSKKESCTDCLFEAYTNTLAGVTAQRSSVFQILRTADFGLVL